MKTIGASAMPENKTITVYTYNELSEEAKERVAQWLNSDGYNYSTEALDSLKALATHFNGKLHNWSIDWDNPSQSSVEFRMPEISYSEFARLLGELGTVDARYGECKLTGVGTDEWAVEGLREAFAAYMPPNAAEQYNEDGDEVDDWDLMSSEDIEELMQAAYWEWIKNASEDFQSQFSDEYVSEACECNEYRFHADGSIA